MKVLQVIPAYVPAEDYGGAPAVSHEISKELIERGHDVTVYTTTVNNGDNQFPAGPDQIDGVDVYRFSLRSNWLASRASIFIPSGFNKKIRNTITEYDVVHVHDYRTPLTVGTVRAAQGTDTSVVFQPHGAFIRTHRFVRLKKIFDKVLGEYLLSNIDCSLALNESQADAIKSLYENADTKVVPNGVPTIPDREFAPNKFRTAYGINENQPLVLYLGRLHESKRIDLAVKAFEKLSDENAVLAIVGPDDGSRDELDTLVSSLGLNDQVIFTGRVPEEQKWQAFIDADLMVTPAFYGFPLTFLEAMAMRTPVLTTTHGQVIKDLEERGGILTDPSPGELAAEMDHVLSDQEYRQRLCDQAYNSIQNYYTWTNIVDEIEQVYEEQ